MVNKAVKKEKKVTDISSKKLILYLNPKMTFSPRKIIAKVGTASKKLTLRASLARKPKYIAPMITTADLEAPGIRAST